jgi:hypothetical protein
MASRGQDLIDYPRRRPPTSPPSIDAYRSASAAATVLETTLAMIENTTLTAYDWQGVATALISINQAPDRWGLQRRGGTEVREQRESAWLRRLSL